MRTFSEYIILLLSQFAGGPGPIENNLMRFGIPAILWAGLLAIAWSRQRQQELPRERLLVWAFGLGLARELFMFAHVSTRVIGVGERGTCSYSEPVEHALGMAAIVLVAGAFVRYILDNAKIARRYLQVGMTTTGVSLVVTFLWWVPVVAQNPNIRFHQTWVAWVFHVSTSLLIVAAILLMTKKRGWLRNVVSMALFFFLMSEVLMLYNYATNKIHSAFTCPVRNAFYIWAIPVFGYVYLREQSIEKRSAEAELDSYREHLEVLVEERTSELIKTNEQLHREIDERIQAETQIARRNAELATQNAIAATISQSLELDTILNDALDMVLDTIHVEAGAIFLLEPDGDLVLKTYRGDAPPDVCMPTDQGECLCADASQLAVSDIEPLIMNVSAGSSDDSPPFILEEGIETLVSVPLISKGRALGALTLGSRRKASESEVDLKLLTAIGQQIGVALENAYLHRQVERAAALEERQRIAAEMHDGLAQTMSYLGYKTDEVIDLVGDGDVDAAGQECTQMRDIIDRAAREVRMSISSLQEQPQPLQSLQTGLTELVESLAGKHGVTVELICHVQSPLFMASDDAEQVLRVVQEALVNAGRHAQAKHVTVSLDQQGESLSIVVVDDGCGFDPDSPPTDGPDHFGLRIMRARAARVEGQVEIDSAPGEGTRVLLTWKPKRREGAVNQVSPLAVS